MQISIFKGKFDQQYFLYKSFLKFGPGSNTLDDVLLTRQQDDIHIFEDVLQESDGSSLLPLSLDIISSGQHFSGRQQTCILKILGIKHKRHECYNN